MVYDAVIVGGGMAGLSAAIYLRRAGKTVLVLENAAYGGQILATERVENYPGFEEISGAELIEKVYVQVEKIGVEFKYAEALKLVEDKSKWMIETDGGKVAGRAVILATGTMVRELGVEGERKYAGKGVSYCATCDGAFYDGKTVAVVGGGNSALYEALYLSGIAKKVYVVNRGRRFKGEMVLVERLREKANVEFLFESSVTGIWGDDKVKGVKIHSEDGEKELAVEGVFVAIGRRANTEVAVGLLELDENGYIVAGEDCRTSVAGVFAIGDCRTKRVRQLVTATGDAAVAAGGVVEFLKV